VYAAPPPPRSGTRVVNRADSAPSPGVHEHTAACVRWVSGPRYRDLDRWGLRGRAGDSRMSSAHRSAVRAARGQRRGRRRLAPSLRPAPPAHAQVQLGAAGTRHGAPVTALPVPRPGGGLPRALSGPSRAPTALRPAGFAPRATRRCLDRHGSAGRRHVGSHPGRPDLCPRRHRAVHSPRCRVAIRQCRVCHGWFQAGFAARATCSR